MNGSTVNATSSLTSALSHATCHWPVGAWKAGEGYLYCGEGLSGRVEERPYCTFHAAQAYPRLKGRAK